MSHLVKMNDSLQRLKKARERLREVEREFAARFPTGTPVEFDRGDMRLVAGQVVSVAADFGALIRPTHKSDVDGPECCLRVLPTGEVMVPWALLFTVEAAAEMHAVRDKLLSKRGGGESNP